MKVKRPKFKSVVPPIAAPHLLGGGDTTPCQDMEAVRMMAATITCDREFIQVLRDTQPLLREEVYKLLKPHVGYPDPRRFDLMSFEADA